MQNKLEYTRDAFPAAKKLQSFERYLMFGPNHILLTLGAMTNVPLVTKMSVGGF